MLTPSDRAMDLTLAPSNYAGDQNTWVCARVLWKFHRHDLAEVELVGGFGMGDCM
jgi:hypothetical protein